MKHYMKYWLLLLCNFFSVFLFAEEVPLTEARSWALNFFQSQTGTRSGNVRLDMVWNGESPNSRANTKPAFYVFNRLDSKGFVIVSGDDLVNPLIGYSLENEFNMQDLPANIQDWLEDMRTEINLVRNNPKLAPRGMQSAWAARSLDVGDVIKKYETAKWDQGEPFNSQCPIDIFTDRRSVTGCTATAMAIALRSRQWPDAGMGTVPSYDYSKHGQNITIPSLSLGHKYNWAKMPLDLNNFSEKEQKDEVARLMYDCGVMAQSEYTSGETAGYMVVAAKSLKEFMKYSPNIDYEERNFYSNDAWYALIQKELDENGPVFYGGASRNELGHAFVLDGYTSKNFYSINWGWGGHCDGFYLLSMMNPENQGIGGDPDGKAFNYKHAAIIGMKKATEGEVLNKYPNIYLLQYTSLDNSSNLYGMISQTDTFQPNVPFILDHVCILNQSTFQTSIETAIAVYNKSGAQKEIVSNIISLDKFDGSTLYNINIECTIKNAIQAGDYLAVAFRLKGTTKWKEIPGGRNTQSRIDLSSKDGVTTRDILVIGSPKEYTGYPGMKVNSENIEFNKSYEISTGAIINTSSSTFNGKISVGVFNKDNQLKGLVTDANQDLTLGINQAFETTFNSCIIKEETSKGDFLAICYKTTDTDTWKRIKSFTGIKGKIALTLQKPVELDKSTSFAYNKATKKIHLTTPAGTTFKLLKADKMEVKSGTATDGKIEINTTGMDAGTYELVLNLNKQSKHLNITL